MYLPTLPISSPQQQASSLISAIHYTLTSTLQHSLPLSILDISSTANMQFTKVIAILSLAATGIAAPTVEVLKRTEGASCDQSQGTLACCVQQPVLQPVSSLGANIAPTLGGILGVIPAILPLIVPTVSVAAQCKSLPSLPR